ncbi:MAG: MASE3 domain-containing protein [Peptococcaceae bacterium]|nr:ATP-binding protein [Peptococcaceae bacterium]MDH7525151.1 MASE3 domain-containing protein [Peptococcaceae bacterium]
MSCILAFFIHSFLWNSNPNVWHTVLEITCLVISLGNFFIVWFTCEAGERINRLVGFGFLAAAVFEALHSYYYVGLKLYPEGMPELSIWYGMLGVYTQVFTLVLWLSNVRTGMNKWVCLALTLCCSFGVSYLAYANYYHLPALLDQNGSTLFQKGADYTIIAVGLFILAVLKNNLKGKAAITGNYFFKAVLLLLVYSFCLAAFGPASPFCIVLGHILSISAHVCLLQGIALSAVVFPYKTIEAERDALAGSLEGIPGGILAFDKRLRNNYANKRALELLGCRREDVRGRTIGEIMKMSGERPGRCFELKRDIYHLENGFLVLFDDPKKELELNNLGSQAQTILNSINNTVLVLDSNQDIVMCNKALAETVRMEIHEILGLNVNEFYRIAAITKRDYTGPGERGQAANSVKLTVFTPDGGKKEMLASETPIYNQDHELTGTIIVGTDVTLLRIEQQKLQQKERLVILGQMAAGIVHEIKNPLTVIKGFSQIIKLITGDNRIMEYIKQIDNETERINKVVTDFLRFARPRPPAFQRLAANELIDSVTMLIESNTFVRGIETVIERGQGDLTVLADADQLKQVLLNIAQNGIDAMTGVERPRLKITSGFNNDTGEVYIAIANNGKPLTPEEKMRMGTPFYSTKEKGTGLGLSICYQIIKEHNGRIDIESEAGHDTVFTVSLPHYGEASHGEKNLAAM